MFGLCKYKHIFGEPRKGVHQYRLFDIAIVDVIMTIIAILLIVKFTKQSWQLVTVIMIILMIIGHRMFCVRTTIDKALFPEN